MSYMRMGYALKYFKTGETKSYVFSSEEGVEDYDDKYEDKKSFCELIGNFVRYSTQDDEYAWKMVQILAKKLGIENELCDKPRTDEELIDLDMEIIKKFSEEHKELFGKYNIKQTNQKKKSE